MQHKAPNDPSNYSALPTLGHEVTHGIHSHFRVKYNKTGKKANGFYALQSRGIIIPEPNVTIADVEPFIPKVLQGFRFDQYIVKQQTPQGWNDRSLYIFDEWVSYINGASVATELFRLGRWKAGSRQDAVRGALEFTVYGIAVAMAVEKKDPTFFQTETSFLEFTAWIAAQAMRVHREGVAYSAFSGFDQATYLKDLQTHADAKPIRDFCLRTFGQKWVDQVIFGKP